MLASGNQFHELLRDEKRVQYQNDFESFIQTHQVISQSDYHYYEVWKKEHIKLTYTGSTKDDTLIIERITPMFRVTYYTYSQQDGYEELATIPLLNGFDADYNNGNIIYKQDFHLQYLDSIHIAYAKENGKRMYTSVAIRLIVIPKNLDNYVAHREGKPLNGSQEIYVAKEYLQNKGIPVNMDK